MYRKPDFIVGPPTDPYLLRWWIIPRNTWANVYLHEFLRSDDDRALHDHPWHSLSIVLSGGYWEHRPNGSRTWYGPGSILWRGATYTHMIELPEKDGKPLPCRTLFLTGPTVRVWGFHCPQGWKPWFKFVNRDEPGSIGPGCDDSKPFSQRPITGSEGS